MVLPLIDLDTPVQLTSELMERAKEKARLRQESKDRVGVYDRRRSREDGYVLHLRGLYAEFGFGMYWGISMDMPDTIRGDGGHFDRILFNHKISIKGIDDVARNVRCFFPNTPTQWPVTALVCVFKVAESGLITPVGFQTPEGIKANAQPWRDLRCSWRGVDYYVFLDTLRPMSELRFILLDAA